MKTNKGWSGMPLEIEDLDLTGLGLYKEVDPDNASDYFPAEEKIGSWGVGYYMRKSEQDKKWVSYDCKELKR